jgi:hypothetical protein
MKKIFQFLFVFIFIISNISAQFLTPYQAVQSQPKVQFDYWVFNTHGGTGLTNQYPGGPSSKSDMDNIFNTANSNTTIYQTGRTNSAKIIDWQSASDLSAIGISVPNSGNYFAIKIQGTFIPLESGNYTFSLETDDACDLTIEGTSVVYSYNIQGMPALGTHTGTISLVAGKSYSFVARMQQYAGGFGLRLFWKSPTQNNAPSSYTSVLPANTYFQSWTQNLQEMVSSPNMDGSSAAKAAPSAKYIQNAFSNYTDGVYWINLPYVGPTQIYCLLNTAINGGGWMMMMKATRGTTFYYGSSYWTGVNTLYPTSYNRNDGDAKFDVMNYFYAKDMMALWPDIPWNTNSSTTGGSVNTNGSYNVWCWLQNNFNNGIRITPINFFNNASKLFFGDAKSFSGWNGGVFSSQTSVRFYGFNYTNASNAQVRWGFAWNENAPLALYPSGDESSNDVSGGIGMNYGSYSAGDYIGCCNDFGGINRTARVEVYIR